ncbi:MAG: hypothetical protein JWQ40_2588 [Segetibacter sp.]|nr:hypothetical protein [Segetibacter sp.]
MEDKKRCFVVMGFGIKTDLATGRKLNLNMSYEALIKPVIESKGMICVRADEIPNSGSIDVPMYKELYKADIVVADLSTANANAFYELGVRYALRPRSTIVMSEDQLCLPFDVNHIKINKYKHSGESLDYFEVLRFQKQLGATLDAILTDETPDSPVYTFLNDLIPPALKDKAEAVATEVNEAISNSPAKNGDHDEDVERQTLSLIVKQGEEAIKNKNYSRAKGLFNSAILLSNCNNQQAITSNFSYLYQRLALATYKDETADKKTALIEANALLEKLDLMHTNDSETVMLAGAIEKKLFEIGEGENHLEDAILLFQRGFYLLNNRYNGINLAYLLNCRAASFLDKTKEEKIADMVWANRIRKDVLAMCEKDWKAVIDREAKNAKKDAVMDAEVLKNQQMVEDEQKFWTLVNKAEAYFGLGNMEEYQNALEQAKGIGNAVGMQEALTNQVDALRVILEKYGNLLNPEWKGQ